jgi:tetratricopeptide (TPR) repeat protein
MLSLNRLARFGNKLATWAAPTGKETQSARGTNFEDGWSHLEARNWAEAEKHFAVAISAKQHPVARRLEYTLGLAEAQRRQSKLPEAEASARQAVAFALESRNHPSRLEALDILVDLRQEDGRIAEAREIAEEIVRLETSQQRPDPAKLVQYTRKLGLMLIKNNEPDKAVLVLERAVVLSEQTYGVDHVETGDNLSTLGVLLRQTGNHAEAQRRLRDALNIHRASHGPDSKEVSEDLYHLAASLEESGDLDGAMSEYEKVLTMRERQLGGDAAEGAMAKVRLGALYLQAGRTSAARELLIHAIRVLEKTGGERFVMALEVLAYAEEYAGRTEEAENCRKKAAAAVAKQQALAKKQEADAKAKAEADAKAKVEAEAYAVAEAANALHAPPPLPGSEGAVPQAQLLENEVLENPTAAVMPTEVTAAEVTAAETTVPETATVEETAAEVKAAQEARIEEATAAEMPAAEVKAEETPIASVPAIEIPTVEIPAVDEQTAIAPVPIELAAPQDLVSTSAALPSEASGETETAAIEAQAAEIHPEIESGVSTVAAGTGVVDSGSVESNLVETSLLENQTPETISTQEEVSASSDVPPSTHAESSMAEIEAAPEGHQVISDQTTLDQTTSALTTSDQTTPDQEKQDQANESSDVTPQADSEIANAHVVNLYAAHSNVAHSTHDAPAVPEYVEHGFIEHSVVEQGFAEQGFVEQTADGVRPVEPTIEIPAAVATREPLLLPVRANHVPASSPPLPPTLRRITERRLTPPSSYTAALAKSQTADLTLSEPSVQGPSSRENFPGEDPSNEAVPAEAKLNEFQLNSLQQSQPQQNDTQPTPATDVAVASTEVTSGEVASSGIASALPAAVENGDLTAGIETSAAGAPANGEPAIDSPADGIAHDNIAPSAAIETPWAVAAAGDLARPQKVLREETGELRLIRLTPLKPAALSRFDLSYLGATRLDPHAADLHRDGEAAAQPDDLADDPTNLAGADLGDASSDDSDEEEVANEEEVAQQLASIFSQAEISNQTEIAPVETGESPAEAGPTEGNQLETKQVDTENVETGNLEALSEPEPVALEGQIESPAEILEPAIFKAEKEEESVPEFTAAVNEPPILSPEAVPEALNPETQSPQIQAPAAPADAAPLAEASALDSQETQAPAPQPESQTSDELPDDLPLLGLAIGNPALEDEFAYSLVQLTSDPDPAGVTRPLVAQVPTPAIPSERAPASVPNIEDLSLADMDHADLDLAAMDLEDFELLVAAPRTDASSDDLPQFYM